jgi:hypothetical protein
MVNVYPIESGNKMHMAGWNMPGCLPEAEPDNFEAFNSAKEFILAELRTLSDELLESGDIESAFKADESRMELMHTQDTPGVEWESGPIDGYAYWIMLLEE